MDTPTAPDGFEPTSSSFHQNPDPFFSKARAQCPVFHDEAGGAFIVTRYEDVKNVIQDPVTYSSHVATKTLPPPADLAGAVTVDPAAATIINTDPPAHTAKRKIINRGVTRKQVKALEAGLRARAHELVDAFEARGSCNLMEEYANPLASTGVVDLLGLPREDIPKFATWAVAMLDLIRHGRQPGSIIGEERVREIYEPVVDALAYFHDVLESRRDGTGQDMTSVLVAARDAEGNRAMDDDEVVVHVLSVVSAGTETTANLIGSTLSLLGRHPDERARVMADPELIGTALEEALRRRPSAVTVQRRTTCPVELAGVEIPEGSMVAASITSACNDETVFEDPERFDLDRENLADSLAFGRRTHFCVGAPLAKLTATVALEVLYERIPGLQVPEDTTEFEPLRGLRMAKQLDGTWEPAAVGARAGQ